jgi:hypothetical protein
MCYVAAIQITTYAASLILKIALCTYRIKEISLYSKRFTSFHFLFQLLIIS